MLAPWVVEEMKTASLRDKRLNARMKMILDQLSSRPTGSIPNACGGKAETEAAYRFFDNDRVSFAEVLQPHVDATLRRIEAQASVILVQDTTEIDLTRPEIQVAGTGPMDGSSRRGLFLHELQALTPDGTPLGTAHALPWVREEGAESRSKLPSHKRVSIPIEEKESYRWVTTLEQAQRIAASRPQTRFVCVADSEADIYELLVAGMAEPRPVDWIVRACHDRTLSVGVTSGGEESQETAESDTKSKKLRESVLATPLLFTQTIQIRERKRKYNCEQRGRRQPRVAAIRPWSSRNPCVPSYPESTVAAREPFSGRKRECCHGSRAKSTGRGAAGGMDSADELANRNARSSTPGDSKLLRSLDDRGLFSDAEVRVPRGSAEIRDCGAFSALSGDLPDRDLADFICLPAGTGIPGHQLRSGLRTGGMATSVPAKS